MARGVSETPLVGESPPIREVLDLIEKVAQGAYPVLIQGESGTGKGLVARSIHRKGRRAERPFMPVDCGAFVATLVESELFGYAPGAFTGAVRAKQGLLGAAQGGTVFLDEIGELPVDLQAKLLRALQEKEIRPVGSTSDLKIDVRIIAATNRDLEAAVQRGSFRKDLFYRLNVVAVRLPPLREHKSDIPLLANHFLEKLREPDRPRPLLSEEAMARLMAYDWPGNVRELENCIERALALDSGSLLEVGEPGGDRLEAHNAALVSSDETVLPLHELERVAILRAVKKAGGDKPKAAELLGIGVTTLYRKLKEYKNGGP